MAQDNKEKIKQLHAAAATGDVPRIEGLLREGVNVAGQLTAPSGKPDESHFAAGPTPLHTAAQAGQVEAIKVLLAGGAGVNAMDWLHQTPLHTAADCGHEGAINTLLDGGADINARDWLQQTPLHKAAAGNYMQAVKALLKRNANAAAVDRARDTPLHETADASIVELLIRHGANVNAANKSAGLTPLHKAGDCQRPITYLNALLAHGADPNQRDCAGRTSLHAVRTKETAEALIAKGANVNALDNGGRTPLHLAASRDVAETLIDRGADINAIDRRGRTPLDEATEKKQKDVAAVLQHRGGRSNAQGASRGTEPMPWRKRTPSAASAQTPIAYVLDKSEKYAQVLKACPDFGFEVRWIDANASLDFIELSSFLFVRRAGIAFPPRSVVLASADLRQEAEDAAAQGIPAVVYMEGSRTESQQREPKRGVGCYVFPSTSDGSGFDPRALEHVIHETISRNSARGDTGRN